MRVSISIRKTDKYIETEKLIVVDGPGASMVHIEQGGVMITSSNDVEGQKLTIHLSRVDVDRLRRLLREKDKQE
jgi:hypothetical protein